MAINKTFREDVNNFIDNHKLLCRATLGLAIVGYAIGKFMGKLVRLIGEKVGAVKKTDHLFQETVKTPDQLISVPPAQNLNPPLVQNIEPLAHEPIPLPSIPVSPAQNLNPPLVQNIEPLVQEPIQPPLNEVTLKMLQKVIAKNQKLPGDEGGIKMTGEEHIAAILFDQLVDQDQRADCAIILKPPSKDVLPQDFDPATTPRYLIVPMSVNNNMHNTILVIDKDKKEFAYFDSLGGVFPEQARTELLQKGAILPSYKEIDSSQTRTTQSDGWSCGFHAVENALCFVNERSPENKYPEGNELRNKFSPGFERFSDVHGVSEDIFNNDRISKRQKIRLRDALESFAQDPHSPLNQLWSELKLELQGDTKDRPIPHFIHSYIQNHPNDQIAAQILTGVISPLHPLYLFMPKSINETEADAALQLDGIKAEIAKILEN